MADSKQILGFVCSLPFLLLNDAPYPRLKRSFPDWTQDATEEGFLKSPVFDPNTGFGGNGYYIDSSNDTSVRLRIPGKTGGGAFTYNNCFGGWQTVNTDVRFLLGCITNGPFLNYTVNMGPNSKYHCVLSGLCCPDDGRFDGLQPSLPQARCQPLARFAKAELDGCGGGAGGRDLPGVRHCGTGQD